MAKQTPETNNTSSSPAPEVLKPQSEASSAKPKASATSSGAKVTSKLRHMTYRPSHKATFIGLAVVVAILAINAAVIAFVMQGQDDASAEKNRDAVTISPAVLETLGVSRNTVGEVGTELTVGPDASFNGEVTIAGNVSIAGQLELNSAFSAPEADFAQLQAGDTTLEQLNVNGDGTISNLSLRENLTVAGITRLQGPVTLDQLLTVNNNLNVAGNLTVGGTLSARSFQANSLVSGSTLTIGGHVITRGGAPSARPGGALGNNGTISISGNDAAGTVAANIGTGAGSGIIATVSFRQAYSTTPHVVVTAVGRGVGSVYVNRSATGFSIGVNGSLAPGGYAFDYIVMQ